MGIDQRGKLRCDWCNKYASFEDSDSLTVFGAVYHSGSPEPYDPEYFCAKCSHKLYQQFKKDFEAGKRSGDWCKSGAEMKAAKECGLKWVSNSTKVHRDTGHEAFNCYVEEKEYDNYLPKFSTTPLLKTY